MRASEKEDHSTNELQRELAKGETEIESLKLRIESQEKMIREVSDKSSDLLKQLKGFEVAKKELEKQIGEVQK